MKGACMSTDKKNQCGSNCSCNEHAHQHTHEDKCNCNNHGGGCSDHECGCSEREHDCITLVLEDDTVLECPIIDTFIINEQSYIALLHPDNQQALIYRFEENDDESLNLDIIDDDDEFNLVTKTFLSINEQTEK